MNPELVKDIAVTCELVGTKLSEPAMDALVMMLDKYPPGAISLALARCRDEFTGSHLTPAHIIQRIDDGRPGPEEAWGMLPRSEGETVVWTDEMSVAADPVILSQIDNVAARMTFKETYIRLTREARDRREPVNWTVSLGYDLNGREAPIKAALGAGRISEERAENILGPGFVSSVPKLPERTEAKDVPRNLASPTQVKELLDGIDGFREK